MQLVPGLPHWWQPMAPRARAWLEVDSEGVEAEGLGYHDTNHGGEQLGARLSGWHWSRTHGEHETVVDYVLPAGVGAGAGDGGARGRAVRARRRQRGPAHGRARAGDCACLGTCARANRVVGAPRLLESSPFYARVEARQAGLDTLGEVADFRRFHSPLIRWMAHFRTRVEAVP